MPVRNTKNVSASATAQAYDMIAILDRDGATAEELRRDVVLMTPRGNRGRGEVVIWRGEVIQEFDRLLRMRQIRKESVQA
jgi:hypothetical protein